MPDKEKYKLQRLLEMRERKREDAAIYLGKCRDQLELEELELVRRNQAVEDCRQEQIQTDKQMLHGSMKGIKNLELVRYRQRLSDLRDSEQNLLNSVKEQEGVVRKAEQTVAKALDDLHEAAKEVKVIEKHRENWENVKRLETKRLEQKRNDEIGTIMHNRQNLE